MEKLFRSIIIFTCSALLMGMDGCRMNEGVMKCPKLSSSAKHHPTFLAKSQPVKPSKQADAQAANNKPATQGLLASTEKGIPVNIKLPSSLYTDADGNDDIDDANKMLNQYSNNKVSIQRKENGKVYLQSKSLKDLLLLTSNLSKSMLHPRGYYEKRYGQDRDGIAIAGGTIGLIAFIFSFIPFLDLLAIPLGIVGIILGAVGIRSHRRHLAIMGLVFGVLALLIAPMTIFFYFAHLGFFPIP